MFQQLCSHILMVRPAAFGYNEESAGSNKFQNRPSASPESILQQAQEEFDNAIQIFLEAEDDVTNIHDTPEPLKPDAIFPNNWIAMMQLGQAHLFPMLNANRRIERSMDIVGQVNKRFAIDSIKDWSNNEADNRFLEGTGSMIFDHVNRIAFAAISDRTSPDLFEEFCTDIGYEAFAFHTQDKYGNPIYHTNVMMSIGDSFALYCEEVVSNEVEAQRLRSKLEELGKEIITISYSQMVSFAGNILQFKNRKNQKCIAISQSAFSSLDESQVKVLAQHGALLVTPIPTIENVGGGSIRCMIAEVFLALR